MLELIAIALLQLASFTSAPEHSETQTSNGNNPIVIVPSENQQGGGGWGGD